MAAKGRRAGAYGRALNEGFGAADQLSIHQPRRGNAGSESHDHQVPTGRISPPDPHHE